MKTMHEIFDRSDADLIDAERTAFEADARPYGFDLTRHKCAAPEPWSEYSDDAAGHRWAGWLSASAYKSAEIERLRDCLERARQICGNAHDMVLRGADDSELFDMLEEGYGLTPNV